MRRVGGTNERISMGKHLNVVVRPLVTVPAHTDSVTTWLLEDPNAPLVVLSRTI
jgi:hypothetical protein